MFAGYQDLAYAVLLIASTEERIISYSNLYRLVTVCKGPSPRTPCVLWAQGY